MSDRSRDNLSLLAGNSKPGFFMAALKSLAPVVIGLVIAYLLQAHVKPNIAPYPAKLLLDIGIAIILAVSLNIVNGFTGQFSMGHAGFLAIGGYVSGMVSYYGSIKMWASSAVNGGAMSTMKGDLSGLPIFAAGDELHDGFVRFDFRDRFARLHGVADVLQPLHQAPFFHGRRERLHHHFGRHWWLSRCRELA